MGKIRVEELAAQMGIGSKEVLFRLQSIGVDVKSPQAALDESTVLAILQGKTHAPKQLIVRDNEARTARPQKSALNRIKIVEKTAGTAEQPESPAPEPEVGRRAAAESKASAKAAEPARTAVVPPEPEAEAPKPALPRKIVLPPRPAPRPAAGVGVGVGVGARPAGPAGVPRPGVPTRPMGPARGPSRPSGPSG